MLFVECTVVLVLLLKCAKKEKKKPEKPTNSMVCTAPPG